MTDISDRTKEAYEREMNKLYRKNTAIVDMALAGAFSLTSCYRIIKGLSTSMNKLYRKNTAIVDMALAAAFSLMTCYCIVMGHSTSEPKWDYAGAVSYAATCALAGKAMYCRFYERKRLKNEGE